MTYAIKNKNTNRVDELMDKQGCESCSCSSSVSDCDSDDSHESNCSHDSKNEFYETSEIEKK